MTSSLVSRFVILRFVVRLFAFGPEAVAGAADEDIFERWFADRDRLNFSRKCLDYVGNNAVSILLFETDLFGEHLSVDVETVTDALGERCGVTGFEDDDVSADFSFQFGRSSREQPACLDSKWPDDRSALLLPSSEW